MNVQRANKAAAWVLLGLQVIQVVIELAEKNPTIRYYLRTPDRTLRLKAAKHILQGKPVMYGMTVTSPLVLSPECFDVLIAKNNFLLGSNEPVIRRAAVVS